MKVLLICIEVRNQFYPAKSRVVANIKKSFDVNPGLYDESAYKKSLQASAAYREIKTSISGLMAW